MSRPQLSIVIVSWNVRELLRECLLSLYNTKQDVGFEVIVVDNASHDGSADMVAQEFTQVRLARNSNNEGFAKACNQGAAQSSGEYILFLNDDTVVFDRTLDTAVSYAQAHSHVGVLGCSIHNPDMSQQDSVRRFPRLWDQMVVLCKLSRVFPLLLKGYLMKGFDYTTEQSVDQVMGAFFLTPRSVYDGLEGFDEGYYFWFEEVDYCKRVYDSGKTVMYIPSAQIIHHGGASIKQLKAVKEQRMFNKVVLRYFAKHATIPKRCVIWVGTKVSIVLAVLVGVVEGVLSLNKRA